MFRGKNQYYTTRSSCSLIAMINYSSALQEYDLEIRWHWRDMYQTSAFYGHVFTMKLLLKNKKKHLDPWQKTNVVTRCPSLLPHSHCSTPPCGGAFAWCNHLFRFKFTNRILQKHHQNRVVPPESGVHPQNPVYTYSVTLENIAVLYDTKMTTNCFI